MPAMAIHVGSRGPGRSADARISHIPRNASTSDSLSREGSPAGMVPSAAPNGTSTATASSPYSLPASVAAATAATRIFIVHGEWNAIASTVHQTGITASSSGKRLERERPAAEVSYEKAITSAYFICDERGAWSNSVDGRKGRTDARCAPSYLSNPVSERKPEPDLTHALLALTEISGIRRGPQEIGVRLWARKRADEPLAEEDRRVGGVEQVEHLGDRLHARRARQLERLRYAK